MRLSKSFVRSVVNDNLKQHKMYIFWRKFDINYRNATRVSFNAKKYFENPDKVAHISFCKKIAVKRTHPFCKKHDISKRNANLKMMEYINKYIPANTILNSNAFTFDAELSRSIKSLSICGYPDDRIYVCERDFDTYISIKFRNKTSQIFCTTFNIFLDTLKKKLCNKFSAAFIDGMSSIGNYKETNNVIKFIKHFAHPDGCVIGFTFVKRLRSYGCTANHEITKFKNRIIRLNGIETKFIEQFEYPERKNIVTLYFYVKHK